MNGAFLDYFNRTIKLDSWDDYNL